MFRLLIFSIEIFAHNRIAGNYKADELARAGTSVSITEEWVRVGAPLASCGSLLDCWEGKASDQLSKRLAQDKT